MYRQSSSSSTRPAADYRLVDGLVDVLTDLFDATEYELPPSLRLAHIWLRHHASSNDCLANCDERLIEALADIAAEARRPATEDPFSSVGIVLTPSPALPL